jgi:hypothetical protein
VEDRDIDANIARYLEGRSPFARYSSFDYCFNYFRSHRDGGNVETLAEPSQLQTSCLQLGFYLASWGMFRGKAELLSHSVKCFEPTIDAIVEAPQEIWSLDVDAYADGVDVILDMRNVLRGALPGGRSDTLVSKVMLGVFGCVPAFDRYFKDGVRKHGLRARTFDAKSLVELGSFFEKHADAIEANRVATLDFVTGEPTDRTYTRAKVLDMIFFMEGYGSGQVVPPP